MVDLLVHNLAYRKTSEYLNICRGVNEHTSLESTAAYIMSIQPLNVAFYKRDAIKYIFIKNKIYIYHDHLNQNLETQTKTDARPVVQLVHGK